MEMDDKQYEYQKNVQEKLNGNFEKDSKKLYVINNDFLLQERNIGKGKEELMKMKSGSFSNGDIAESIMNCSFNRRNETFSFLVQWKPKNREKLFASWETEEALYENCRSLLQSYLERIGKPDLYYKIENNYLQ